MEEGEIETHKTHIAVCVEWSLKGNMEWWWG
jgi:hypothetical protein